MTTTAHACFRRSKSVYGHDQHPVPFQMAMTTNTTSLFQQKEQGWRWPWPPLPIPLLRGIKTVYEHNHIHLPSPEEECDIRPRPPQPFASLRRGRGMYWHDQNRFPFAKGDHHSYLAAAEEARAGMAMAAITHSFSQRNQDGE